MASASPAKLEKYSGLITPDCKITKNSIAKATKSASQLVC